MPPLSIFRPTVIFLIAALALPLQGAAAACPAPQPQPQLWFEDNNLSRAGGMPQDFLSKFHAPAWKHASRYIDVYMIRLNVIAKLDDAFLARTLRPYLQQHRLAVDASGATWLHSGNRHRHFEHELRQLRRLRRLNIPVGYISLQSPLSKPLRGGSYPMRQRIADIGIYAAAARRIYPEAKIGIIDALPTHGADWRAAYTALLATGSVDYVHLDVPYERIGKSISWEDIRRVEKFIEGHGKGFGLLLTTRTGGETSDQAYRAGVKAELAGYRGHCGSPAAYVITSWFPHPARTVPAMTNLIKSIGQNLAEPQPAD